MSEFSLLFVLVKLAQNQKFKTYECIEIKRNKPYCSIFVQ